MAKGDALKALMIGSVVVASLSAAPGTQTPGTQTFIGTITDSECEAADHSRMQMGPTDADCVIACVGAHGAKYVLFDGKDAYTLSDQETPEEFAAQKVRVTGTLNAATGTIQVDSISAVN